MKRIVLYCFCLIVFSFLGSCELTGDVELSPLESSQLDGENSQPGGGSDPGAGPE